jgi:hypothetical protein
VLDLAPSKEGRRRANRRLVAVLVVLAAALAGGSWVSRWLSATSPTFTTAEVVSLYSSPGSVAPGDLDWDPTTVTSEDPDDDGSPLAPQPSECLPLIGFAVRSDGVAQVLVRLTNDEATDQSEEVESMVITELYPNPARARMAYEATATALARCTEFRLSENRVTVSDVALGQDRRARSDLSFQLTVAEDRSTRYRLRLVRFGNSLTWTGTGTGTQDAVQPFEAAHARIPDRVVSGLQRIYRDRD